MTRMQCSCVASSRTYYSKCMRVVKKITLISVNYLFLQVISSLFFWNSCWVLIRAYLVSLIPMNLLAENFDELIIYITYPNQPNHETHMAGILLLDFEKETKAIHKTARV